MRRFLGGTLGAAAMAMSAAAVSLGAQQDRSSTAVATPVLPYYSAAPVGASEQDLLHRMSDANILGHLAVLDSIEIALSDWTINYSKSDAITAYAKAMDARYRNNLDRDHQLGTQTGVGLTTMAGELKRSHIGPAVDSVINASDVNLDRFYIMSQLQLHRHMLDELTTLQSTARHPAIRGHIAGQIDIIRDELERARQIALTRGFISKKSA